MLVLDGLQGMVSTRIEMKKTENSAPHMQRRLHPDLHWTEFTGCDDPLSLRMPQQPADTANVNGPSLWVLTDARKRLR